jgi:hypothetical protein
MVKRATVGATTTTPSMSFSAQSKEQATLQAAAEAAEEEDSDEEGLLDGDDDDSAFMARYRRQRMRQIAGTQGLPKFGECLDVEPFEFVEELKCDARVAVVTLLHEDWIPDCREVAHAFDRLARKHVHTKFLRMKATSCSAILKSIDHRKDLPCIMIYRGGETEHVLIKVAETMGEFFTEEDVEYMLQGKGAFDSRAEDVNEFGGGGGAGGAGGGFLDCALDMRPTAINVTETWEDMQGTKAATRDDKDEILVSTDAKGKHIFAKKNADGYLERLN